MGIDWFTFVAQIVNFLILIWLLKRFLYKPVLNAIDAREKRIGSELTAAAAKMAEAVEEQELYRNKNQELENQRTRFLKTAAEEGEMIRQRLQEDARSESEALRQKLREGLDSEFAGLKGEIVRRTHGEVFAIAGKVLADLAGAELEQQMVARFISQLAALDDGSRQRLQHLLESGGSPPMVRSAFNLGQQRTDLEQSIHAAFAYGGAVEYAVDPELISGIELTINGYKLAWSIADYLQALESRIEPLVSARAASAAMVDPHLDQPDGKQP